jgi:hypothetical protein
VAVLEDAAAVLVDAAALADEAMGSVAAATTTAGTAIATARNLPRRRPHHLRRERKTRTDVSAMKASQPRSRAKIIGKFPIDSALNVILVTRPVNAVYASRPLKNCK